MLGGAGHVGTAISRQLAEAGYRVTASTRRDVTRPGLAGTGIRLVTGDDRRSENLDRWIADADLVVDAATPYPLAMFDRTAPDPVAHAVARTGRILDAVGARGAGLIHISSFVTEPRNEDAVGQWRDAVMRGLHRYFDVKLQTERAVRTALKSGLKGAVIAPATCLGPFDQKPREQCVVPMLLAGKVRALVRHPVNVVDVRDVATLVAGLADGRLNGQKLPIWGHNIRVTDLAARICAMGGVSAPKVTVPPAIGLAGMIWMETAYAAIGRQPPQPSLPMMLVAASYPATPLDEQQALLPVLRPLDDTLRDALSWYRAIGYC